MTREEKENKRELKVFADFDDVVGFFTNLDDEVKDRILDLYTASQIIDRTEKHLRNETDLWGFTTGGYNWGGNLRTELAKIQGLEPEWKKDFESRIRSLEHDVEHKKRYYDWYFRAYHSQTMKDSDGWHGKLSLWTRLINEIGEPK